MIDVIVFGEVLIDFLQSGSDLQHRNSFTRYAGGAPANLAVMLAKLGKKVEFVGKVGQDSFGTYLKEILNINNVGTEGLVMSPKYSTPLVFVQLDENGDRSFDFYRKNTADVMLEECEISLELLDSCRLFHFGSVSMTSDPSRSATLRAVQEIKKRNKTVSYDPNYRSMLWKSEHEAIEIIRSGMSFADIIKISDEEMELLTGESDIIQGLNLLNLNGPKIIFITAGSKGTWYSTALGQIEHVSSFQVQTVDTTGAGDTFFASALSQILELDCALEQISMNQLQNIVTYANAAAALSTTAFGAIASLPSHLEITELIIKKEENK